MSEGCSPEDCAGCTGCGVPLEKITLRIEWRHQNTSAADVDAVTKMMNEFASELMVSGVELIYINNTYSPDIPENSSEFRINGHQLSELVPGFTDADSASKEIIRKGIFQALLRNI